MVDADGRNLRKLGRAGPPDWSPNGELLAFHPGRGCVVTTARFTSEQGRIPGPCGVPEFSPDSGSLAFETGSHCAVAATPLPGRLAVLARERRLLPLTATARSGRPTDAGSPTSARAVRQAASRPRRNARRSRTSASAGSSARMVPAAGASARPTRRTAPSTHGLPMAPGLRSPRGLAAPGRVAHRPDEAHRPAARVRLVRVAALVGRRHSSDDRGAHGVSIQPRSGAFGPTAPIFAA